MAAPSLPPATTRTDSGSSTDSVTAMDYINSQLALESEAREALPYSFDSCTRPLGQIRQAIYACKTCIPSSPTPPPAFGVTKTHGAAALCYSCSISCHGDHELVEIFDKRSVRCDCGTGKLPGVRCEIRKAVDEQVEGEYAYNQNYWGRFCTCEILYEPEKEIGMMHQCMLGDVCQEDWFHDSCMVGQPPPTYTTEEHKQEATKDENKGKEHQQGVTTKDDSRGEETTEITTADAPTKPTEVVETAEAAALVTEIPAVAEEDEEDEEDKEEESRAASLGFPKGFGHMICWRCVDANPWIRRFAGYPGFFALARKDATITSVTVGASPPQTEAESEPQQGQKRKAEDDLEESGTQSPVKRVRPVTEDTEMTSASAATKSTENSTTNASTAIEALASCSLPPTPTLPETFSLLLPSEFRSQLCRCPNCFPHLGKHRVLLEEEETHEQPLSRAASPTGSIFEEGERALNSIDRVRAIEGVLAYNKLKDRVKAFLEPFAKSGKIVGREDVEGYFEGLKGEGK
ncbi:hypothetical protein K440DRAFT_103005 [Wilcoxina mikolae CBS 423.85]|nr:hypothetical protein K440DRAFT_103005 [Wilcoxina mikolae CBS 423.85]